MPFGPGGGGGGGGGAVAQLYKNVLASSAASFDITSISDQFLDLQLVMMLRSDYASATVDGADLTFNGDTGTNYLLSYFYGLAGATGPTSGPGSTAAVANIGIGMSCAGSPADYFSTATVSIPFYTSTAAYKTASALAANPRDATHLYATYYVGQWRDTSAITEITITPANGSNWLTGSSVALYGWN